MKKAYLRSISLVLLAALMVPPQIFAQTMPDPVRQRVDDAVAKVRPALVRIHVVATDYYQGREVKHEGSGSGVIISKDGYVLSNHHVAGHAKRIVCTLADNEEIEAELIGSDALSDISLIKLTPSEPREFPFAAFGNSDEIRVGDYVLAMGSPLALSQSVTLGIISNTKMVMPEMFWPFNRFTLDGEDVGSIVRWIAHDAAIYGGNSGGPLVNLDGEIIGINEMRMGLAGAIPGNLAQDVARELLAKGKVIRAWLGLQAQPLLKHGPHEKGLLVSGVIKDSPAQEAGFESGDILLSLDREELSVRFREELPLFNRFVSALPIAKPVKAVVLRDGKEVTLTVVPIEREEMQPDEHELRTWGMTARNLSRMAAKEMKLESADGGLVTSIRPGGPCGEAKPAIRDGDVIVAVAGKPMTSVEELIEWTRWFTKDKDEPSPVMVTFISRNQEFVTVVEVGISELEDPGLEARKAWIPIATQVITRDIARAIDRPEAKGIRITQVFPKSTAEEAGLKVGDMILELDGEPIPASYPEDYEVFPTMVRQYRIGTVVDLLVLRDGEEMTVPVELIRAPKLDREMKKYRDDNFEFTARELAFFDKMEERWEQDQEGVLISEVQQGGWAAIGQLGVEDLLLEVNGNPTPSLKSLEKMMKQIGQEEPKTVTFKVLRGIYTLYLEIEPQWENEE